MDNILQVEITETEEQKELNIVYTEEVFIKPEIFDFKEEDDNSYDNSDISINQSELVEKSENDYNNSSSGTSKIIVTVRLSEKERRTEHSLALAECSSAGRTCALCARGFDDEDEYAQHMMLHHLRKTHRCKVCHLGYDAKASLADHLESHYLRFRCVLCQEIWRNPSDAVLHLASTHPGDVYPCPVCEKMFKRLTGLKRHLLQEHGTPSEHRCAQCGEVFLDRIQYKRHLKNHKEDAILQCSMCKNRTFKNRYYLQRHLRTHEERAACPQCGSLCRDPQALAVHVMQHDPVNQSQRACRLCPRVCSTPAMLRRHAARMHDPAIYKKFECDYCGKKFKTKGELREHIGWSHLGAARAHRCGCGRVFRTPARLRAHVAATHLKLRAPKHFLCELCDKAFATNAERNRHKRVHTSKRYSCEECGESFRSRDYVKVHHKLKHLHMTRDQIKRENQEKREKRMREIDRVHMNNFKLFLKNSRKKVKVKNSVQSSIVSDTVMESDSDIRIPMFNTFAEVQTFM